MGSEVHKVKVQVLFPLGLLCIKESVAFFFALMVPKVPQHTGKGRTHMYVVSRLTAKEMSRIFSFHKKVYLLQSHSILSISCDSQVQIWPKFNTGMPEAVH